MRLDLFLVKNMHISSRNQAQDLISKQLVLVNNRMIDKPHYDLKASDQVQILDHEQYVSRGAYKLLAAIDAFQINFSNKVVVDIGSSTGGWTQVALINRAKKVYAIDVGTQQMHPSLINNSRVCLLENTNYKDLTPQTFNEKVDILMADVSFISLIPLIKKIPTLFNYPIKLIFLIKPQFEVPLDIVNKYKGVIKDKKWQNYAINKIVNQAHTLKWKVINVIPCPILGKSGNQEYLIYIKTK